MIALSPPLLIVSGMTAYIISSWLLVFLHVIGATNFYPRIYWACFFFGGTTGMRMFAARVLHAVAMALVIPLVYVLIFEVIGNADLRLGALIGMAHGLAIGITLPLVSVRGGCRKAPAPGLFGWRLGKATPLLLLVIYGLYGATLGYVYVVASP